MDLTLLTCNIRFDNPADGQNSWAHRRLLLTQTLLAHSPDVIATQEGRFDQLQDLASLLPEFEMVDAHRSWIRERMYPTFFVRKNSFELLGSEDLWLSKTPDIAGSLSFESTFPRLMSWIRLQPKGTAGRLFLVNTHLDHVKSQTRIEQVRVLSEQVKKQKLGPEYLALMGDFNDGPDSPVRQKLLQEFPGLQDTWKLFHSREESSHHPFSGSMPEGSRIDWILVDERMKVLGSELDKSSFEGRYPTDHFPVMAKLKV